MRIIQIAICGIAALGLAACSGGEDNSAAADSQAGAPAGEAAPAAEASPAGPSLASAPAAFGQCAACHSLQPGKNGIGPSLFGVYGTKAGDIAGYSSSPALKASGLTWDDATLDKWLEAPMKTVPGTKMTYAGLKDPAKRQELIAFMKTLK